MNAATWTKPGQSPASLVIVLPECSDDVLLDELSVVVTAGWELPTRPSREASVRHLLLLTEVDSAQSFRQAAQRLLTLLDDALRGAGNEVLGEDERDGCRVLLGVHPSYRTTTSPTRRRYEAAELLVPEWQERPPRDRAGTFQRRHQRSALRQVLTCLREHFGQDSTDDYEYDLLESARWYKYDADRQMVAQGETAALRIRQDGLTSFVLFETELDQENLQSSELEFEALEGALETTRRRIELDRTRPGVRKIVVDLSRPFRAGEVLHIKWTERMAYARDPAYWIRHWVNVGATNAGVTLEMSATFAEGAVPSKCWWYSSEPEVDANEIEPRFQRQLVDVGSTRTAAHSWRPREIERRRRYGLVFEWLDNDEKRAEWESSRLQLHD